jgi:hypothetical protein
MWIYMCVNMLEMCECMWALASLFLTQQFILSSRTQQTFRCDPFLTSCTSCNFLGTVHWQITCCHTFLPLLKPSRKKEGTQSCLSSTAKKNWHAGSENPPPYQMRDMTHFGSKYQNYYYYLQKTTNTLQNSLCVCESKPEDAWHQQQTWSAILSPSIGKNSGLR